jgi:hypothetical protein
MTGGRRPRANAAAAGAGNVEFLHGHVGDIPLPGAAVGSGRPAAADARSRYGTSVTERTFSVDEARGLIPEVRERIDAIVAARADLTELALDLRTAGTSPLGGTPEAKAYEARIDEAAGWFTTQGIEVKGIAPVLVDFPSVYEGQSVRLCFLEGETELHWYHRTELGFAGRRPLP